MGDQTGKLTMFSVTVFPISRCAQNFCRVLIACAVNILFLELDARYCGVLAEGLCIIIYVVAYNVVLF